MMATTCTRAPFTYIWIIENFSELTYIDLKSPMFRSPSVSTEEWFLRIDENFDISCYLQSEDAPRDEKDALDVEFSFLAADGSPLISKRNAKTSLVAHLLTRADFLARWSEFIPNNTLTVQCRVWRKGREIPTTDICCARTTLKTYTGSFLWPVKEFSALNSSAAEDFSKLALDEKKVYSLKPHTQKGPFMALILYLKRNSESEDVYVDLLIEKGRDYAFSFELSVLNANGDIIQTMEERGRTYFSWAVLRFSPLISKNKLIDSKNLLLTNDTLFLKCSFEVYTGAISSEIEYCTPNVSPVIKEEEPVLDFFVEEMDAGDTLEFEEYFLNYLEENDFDSSVEENSDVEVCNKLCPLKTALKFLLSDATLSDVSLRSGTKLYSVHKNILCSKSPVFKTIFSKDLEENNFEINGLDENTLYRLLQYIYTETVENLQFEKALDLYKASVDFQLLDLKNKCSDLLILNLSKYNVRDILSLSSRYQDEKLEMAGRDFAIASGLGKKLKIFRGSKRSDKCNLA